MKAIIVVVLLLVCTAYAHAQDSAELYQAEIIVFKQIDADLELRQIQDISPLASEQNRERATLDLYQTTAHSSVRAVPSNRLQLAAEAQRIERDSRYQLLYHGAWQQPPYDRSRAPHINILREPQNGLLKGTAWMGYGGYFKLLLDFQYDPDYDQASEVLDVPQTFSVPISVDRIIAENKLFYIDHPIIGVITLITKTQ
ncbi:MAG: hypothetical protein GDA45_04035 [Chromatiales bacterium]|nr:hypothetical protein [Chromatiales bacterium]